MPVPQALGTQALSQPASELNRLSVKTSCLLPRGTVLLALLISLVMIGVVYRDLSPTWDEPAHIGNGIAWLTPPHRMIDPVDPPAGRVSAALGPWLFGAEAVNIHRPWDAGNLVLSQSGHYWRTATLARLGILPWYLLAVFLVWSMTRRWLGEWPAALAAVLFIFCPPILANASLATTDVPFLAAFLLAVDRIWIALLHSGWRNYAWAGFAIGLACASKMSGLPFLFLMVLVLAGYLWFAERKAPAEARHPLPRFTAVVFTFAVMLITIWAAYRFQTSPVISSAAGQRHAARLAAKTGPLRPAIMALLNHMPASQFLQGIRDARTLAKHPPRDYLFGHNYTRGYTWFFFFMLMVKTPIPLLILGLAGLCLALRALLSGGDLFVIVPLAGFFIPMLIATASHVHLGIRHILVVYAFLAMLSAFAARWLIARSGIAKPVKIGALCALVAWNVTATLIATPDFLPWYNEISAPWATEIHLGSDYDWGQDLSRLSTKLRDLHADQAWITYNGSLDLNQFSLPPWQPLPEGKPVTGWIAISEARYRTQPEAYGWLAAYKPVAIAGKTIRIYHIQ
ncbi:ArnT family glycosyltransferase [Paracidobacterium acidisoli]|uniref:Phospholipid carrier-dependent glycosyltransferase n=1 Tax=Paracidobacterium acidisoli TaxID=2303751 RepID=A0A372IM50_9BACT|nr:glycosyltransferase family 39 protein [Paracidobacterium acidisoli]MBT9332428.1 glycosyltransferase family 39 protein [Paracidobacterium acidisoli]